MDISFIADTLTIATAQQGLGFAKFLLKRHDFISNYHISLYDNSADQSSAGILQISAVIFPVDAIAPPPVKPNSCKTFARTLLRKKRRTRRGSSSGDSEDAGEEGGFFGDGDGGGYDGPFGGGSGGGWGGSGWNFDGFGGQNWDESSSSPSWSDPAMDFVYEVICWIALSNCVHFAFKKAVRIVAAGEREKEPMRFTSVY